MCLEYHPVLFMAPTLINTVLLAHEDVVMNKFYYFNVPLTGKNLLKLLCNNIQAALYVGWKKEVPGMR